MNISKIMPMANYSVAKNMSTPSFGMARLNDVGRASADEFGYQKNTFLNEALFEKAGLFEKAAIAQELENGGNFEDICQSYGCTENAGSNAAFIKNQVLSKKGVAALKHLDTPELMSGLTKLYDFNYDNPELSVKDTKALLELISSEIDQADYVKNVGILNAGVQKK